jgi:hypothetical protein
VRINLERWALLCSAYLARLSMKANRQFHILASSATDFALLYLLHSSSLDSDKPCRNGVLSNGAVNNPVTKKTGWHGLHPVCRAEYRSFRREQPAGVRQGGRTLTKGQESLSSTPGESEERRSQAATGPPFLWLLSFGGAKESDSPSGARPRFK